MLASNHVAECYIGILYKPRDMIKVRILNLQKQVNKIQFPEGKLDAIACLFKFPLIIRRRRILLTSG